MGLPLNQISISSFGGGNWSDQPALLAGRSHQRVEGGFAQAAPAEAPNLKNIDFVERSIGKRLGSALLESLAGVMIAGDAILDCKSHYTPSTSGALGSEVQVAVGTKGIYTNQSGTWARITNANATAFQWPTDITKVSLIPADGRMFILPDQGTIQVYRSGTALNNQLRNSTTTTTLDVNSNSGQKVVSVAATTMFRVGDRVNLGVEGGGAGAEQGYIGSISAGISITLEDNLTNNHLVSDIVSVANLYVEAKGGATQTITGDWQNGTFLGFYLHERLCFGIGDSIWEYTDVSQPWDLAGGGYYQARGNITAAVTFTPGNASELNALGFLSTTAGPEFVPGFDLSDVPKPMQGGGTAINHRVIATLDNWIVYLTTEGSLEGVSYGQTIDLGRRFKALDGATGPLDTLDPTQTIHQTLPFVFYNRDKKQAQWFYPDGTNTTNTSAVILDFYLGEPVQGEPLESFERRIRCLYWTIKEPGTNAWFVAVYQKKGSVVGVLATGLCYTMESGKNDLGSIPILSGWYWGDFNGGVHGRNINWRRLACEFKERGNWNVQVRKFLDRSAGQSGSDVDWSMLKDGATYDTDVYDAAVYASGGLLSKTAWLEVYASEIRLGVISENADEDWVMTSLTLEYQPGSRQD